MPIRRRRASRIGRVDNRPADDDTISMTTVRSVLLASAGVVLLALLLAGCGPERATATPAVDASVHQEFSLTHDELADLVSVTPAPTRSRVAEDPGGFLSLVRDVLAAPAELIVLVDKNNPLPATYAPDDLVPLSEFAGRIGYAVGEREISRIIAADLIDMAAAARREGVELIVQSAYRSYEYQAQLFTAYAARHGEVAASMFSARPGRSQHQLGTAVDFAPIAREFADMPAGRWLAEHAWRFGFSLSYPEGYEEVTGYIYEPWHFRYVGRAAARLEREFFAGVQQHMLEFLHARGDLLRDAATARIGNGA
ncbi:MAG: D-alanyl-D-alanine carboxypeptidase family protein [Spirochaetaceae bacterium]|nr:MAG: D-alanyl-D-alanine carboxypeptidase family protein [Spirochaetaceae bacterium]